MRTKKVINKHYKLGVQAWQDGKRLSECPFKHATYEWQQWINGWSDRSEQGFLALVKIHPEILIDRG